MRKTAHRTRAWPAAFAATFAAGALAGWMAHAYGPPKVSDRQVRLQPDAAAEVRLNPDSTHLKSASPNTAGPPRIVATTGKTNIRLPIDGMNVEALKGGFAEHRPGHEHDAVDILAARNTPIHAVEDGTIAKLYFSKGGGGNTIYEFDPSGRLCYYYAHLERYADGLHDGQKVSKGDVIGYVGTSGNAPPNTPHLHFAVYQLDDTHRWWKGQPIDPYPILSGQHGG